MLSSSVRIKSPQKFKVFGETLAGKVMSPLVALFRFLSNENLARLGNLTPVDEAPISCNKLLSLRAELWN